MFRGLQTALKAWVDKPDTPLPVLVEAAAALPTSDVIRPTSAYLNSVGSRIRSHLGCRGATALLSVDGTADGQCSLLLTLSARAIPGAIYG